MMLHKKNIGEFVMKYLIKLQELAFSRYIVLMA